MKLLRLLTASAASVSLLCASVQATAQAPAPPTKTAPSGTVPGPALWKLSDADTTIYLFGTVHALPKDKPWFDTRISRAYDSAAELVTEVDMSNIGSSAQVLASAGTLPADQSLRGLMKPDDRTEYEASLVSLGLPIESLDRFEPWFAAMTLSLLPLLRGGYDSQNGVELALQAKVGERTRTGLETIEQQVALFDALPMEAQLAFLDQTVEQVPKATDTLNAMVAEWIEGDAEALAAMLNEEMKDAALYDRLLTQRNAHWADWIKQRMDKPGTVFIAVGAGHLAGRGSVQDQLGTRGFKVERVWQ
jgi:uncharacterized protein YbaP (TraB family)